jgi:hypothetical protein
MLTSMPEANDNMDVPAPLHESFEMVYLDPSRVCFAYDGENLTFTDAEGTFYPRVTLRRCFPLSAKDCDILVRLPDKEMDRGQEIGLLTDVEDLDESSRQAVQRELRLHYFVPAIQQIVNIREEFGFLYWSVDTDRGHKEFVMRDSPIGSVRKVSEGRWLVIDINQTRYEVFDINTLDQRSQELLRKFLLL